MNEDIKNKKNNARLYPIYKMFSCDLIFYYSISFIFLVQTKNLNVAQIMFADALYPIFKIILQIPGLTIIDKIGKKKSIIIGNMALAAFLIVLMISNNIIHVIIANFICAFAFSLKSVAEPNLIYDSVTQKKGKGMYSKIEEVGARNYYYLDGITSMFTGFLFVINEYLPMLVSLIFVTISIGLTTGFKEIYKIEKDKSKTIKTRILDYKEELRISFKFIIQSKRLQALMIFVLIFNGVVYVSYTLREGLLAEMNVPAQYFAIIISTFTIISGVFVRLQSIIHTKLKNKALTFLSMLYLVSFILVGLICTNIGSWGIIITLCLLMFALQYAIQGPYYTLIGKYLKSFANSKMRVKIDSAFNLIRSVSEFIMAMIASYLLGITTAKNNFLMLGIGFSVIMIIILSWMKPRFGLKPEQYNSKDIKFKETA